MIRPFIFFLSLSLLGVWIAGSARLSAQVMPVSERSAILQEAREVFASSPSLMSPDSASRGDPFNFPVSEASPADESTAVAETALNGRAADREVLEAVAEQIRPGGRIQYRGSVFLLFGEARFGLHDLFTVEYRGSRYEIEIVEIQREFFSLRLNDEVIQKPLR